MNPIKNLIEPCNREELLKIVNLAKFRIEELLKNDEIFDQLIRSGNAGQELEAAVNALDGIYRLLLQLNGYLEKKNYD